MSSWLVISENTSMMPIPCLMLLKESYKVEDIQDKSYQKKHPKTQIQGNLENQHTVGIGWIWFTIAFVDFPEIALWLETWTSDLRFLRLPSNQNTATFSLRRGVRAKFSEVFQRCKPTAVNGAVLAHDLPASAQGVGGTQFQWSKASEAQPALDREQHLILAHWTLEGLIYSLKSMGTSLSGGLQYSVHKKEMSKVKGNLIKKTTPVCNVFVSAFHTNSELAQEMAS